MRGRHGRFPNREIRTETIYMYVSRLPSPETQPLFLDFSLLMYRPLGSYNTGYVGPCFALRSNAHTLYEIGCKVFSFIFFFLFFIIVLLVVTFSLVPAHFKAKWMDPTNALFLDR